MVEVHVQSALLLYASYTLNEHSDIPQYNPKTGPGEIMKKKFFKRLCTKYTKFFISFIYLLVLIGIFDILLTNYRFKLLYNSALRRQQWRYIDSRTYV